MTDILQRVGNMLVDCSIGPMRTLKTDELTRVLCDAHEEIERLRAREKRLVGVLNRIEYLADEMMPGRSSYVGAIRDTARAALGEEKK